MAFELTVFIPTADNEGKPFDQTHHATLEYFLAMTFGGYTREPNTAHGGWLDEGHLYHDTHLVYTVALRSIADGGRVSDVVDFVKDHYDQLAVYIRYLGQAEII